MENESPEFWAVFRRAADLRETFQEIVEQTSMEQKRARIIALKREALNLLHEAGLPHPLKMLMVDLWGGFGFAERHNPVMFTAAQIEAKHPYNHEYANNPSTLGKTKLSRLINEELSDTKDYTRQIVRWRNDPSYWELVFNHREDEFRPGPERDTNGA